MDEFINTLVTGLNSLGRGFCGHAAAMFLQLSVFVAVLLASDILLRHRVRATVRYWIWMLVFIKLLLPPTLSLPTGIGYWCGERILLSPTVATPALERAGPPLARGGETPGTAAAMPTGDQPDSNRGAAESLGLAVTSYECLTWQGAVFLLWGGGVLVLGGWVIQRLFFVRRLVAQSRPAQGEALEMLDQCRRRMGIRQNVGLRLSSGSYSPAVCGLLKPTILVPPVLLERLSPDRLRPVLIHELAHVKRGDLWVNCLQTVLQIIYFYNPLVWLAGALVRRVREQAVDEMTLVALGAEAGSYSGTLIDIAEMAFLRANSALGLVGVAESKKALEGRIRHMVTRPIPTKARVGAWGLLVVLGIAAVLLPMAQAQPQEAMVPTPQPTVGQGAVAVLNGVRAELVSVCQNPFGDEPQYCRPDGTPMEEAQANPPWLHSQSMVVGFVLKFTPAEDVHYRSRVFSVHLLDTYLQMVDPDRPSGVFFRDPRSGPPVELPKQADIEVDVAAGPWRTDQPLATRAGRAGTGPLYLLTSQTPEGQDIILSGLRPDPKSSEMSQTLVEITTTATDVDICPECTTKDGRHLPGHFRGGPLFPDGRLWQGTFGFAAPIEEIQTIVIKQRPFHHVVFRNVSLRRGQKTKVLVSTEDGVSPGAFRTYYVNRSVADFPAADDMSTPEAAYAAINRIDRNDPSAWQKVSTAALAERMARAGNKREAAVDAEWAKVLANARIGQVIVWNNTRAAVMAELPQALSSKKIVAPIDVRYLELENGRWLNTGNDRFWTTEEATAKFRASIEKTGAGQ